MSKYPKGECYQNAFNALIEKQNEQGWKVVHGICIGRGPIAGVEFGHAWLEQTIPIGDGGFNVVMAFDPSANVFITAEYYRQLGGVQYAVEYEFDQLWDLVEETGTYGPFDERIKASVHR